jgi:virginiamycin B lyase
MFVEYFLPGDARISYVRLDHDGNIWIGKGALKGPGNILTRLDPRTGQFTDFPFPDPKIYGSGYSVDSQGYVYWIESEPRGDVHLGRLDPKTGKMDRYPIDPKHEIPNVQGHTTFLDSKENVWFELVTGNRIGVWDRKTEKIKLWTIPTENSFPYGLIVDKKDKVWFGEFNSCQVGKFDPVTETFKEYRGLTPPCVIKRPGVDSAGMIWYPVNSNGKLGKLDPETGERVEYDVLPRTGPKPKLNLTPSSPYDVIEDQGKDLWFSDDGLGGALIKFNPRTKKFTYYPQPRQTDSMKLDLTREGGIVYTTRSNPLGAVGIMYPDTSKMTTYAAFRQ